MVRNDHRWTSLICRIDPIAIQLVPAQTMAINQYVTERHYLHRGRTMAQFGYWVLPAGAAIAGEVEPVMSGLWALGSTPILGAVHFAYPRASGRLYGYPTLELLELARLYLEPLPDGSNPKNMASMVLGAALRRVQRDWQTRYPHMPQPKAVVSWADSTLHDGTIYRAANFARVPGLTVGKRSVTRKTGPVHADLERSKIAFIYPFKPPEPRMAVWLIYTFAVPIGAHAADVVLCDMRIEAGTHGIHGVKGFRSPDGLEIHIPLEGIPADHALTVIEALGSGLIDSLATVDLSEEAEGVYPEQAIVAVTPAAWAREKAAGRWVLIGRKESTR